MSPQDPLSGSSRRRAVAPLVDPDLCTRRLRVAARDVVYIKGILEAWEGLAVMFAEAGGELTIAAPRCRERELDEVLDDVARELGLPVRETHPD